MITNEHYENLANAIVIQAVKDYQEANRKIAKCRRNMDAEHTRKECLRFFKSDWFAALTEVDCNLLLSKLDKEV